MKFFNGMLIVLVMLAFGSAQAGEGTKYGKPLTLKKTTKVSEILANPEKFNGKKVLVEGAIVGVCEERGCWIKVASDKEYQAIQFKVEDGVIVFPLDAKGKNAVAEGVVSVKHYTKEELIEAGKKHAEKEGKEFNPADIKGPKTVIQIKGEGAVIK